MREEERESNEKPVKTLIICYNTRHTHDIFHIIFMAFVWIDWKFEYFLNKKSNNEFGER